MNVIIVVGALVFAVGVFVVGFLVGKKNGARVAAAAAKIEAAVKS